MATGSKSVRTNRFFEDVEIPAAFRSLSLNNLRQYYNGDTLTVRMNKIRETISYIRENWVDKQGFVDTFIEGFDDLRSETVVFEIIERISIHPRQWTKYEQKNLDFDMIRLYTSDEGYAKIFSCLNSIFRADDSTGDNNLIRLCVIIIEMLNIDLFFYCKLYPNVAGFSGVVYRGMVLSNDDVQSLIELLKKPIKDRYIAIPLCLMSATTDINIAKQFSSKEHRANNCAVILKIHVLNMRPDMLQMYTERFNSVVSTICAVNIEGISECPEEKEVLLRGPFFQVLSCSKSEEFNSTRVFDMVMVNSNRDHKSTSELGQKSEQARTMFSILTAITRYKFASNFCQSHNLVNDCEEYKQAVDESTKLLTKLIEETKDRSF